MDPDQLPRQFCAAHDAEAFAATFATRAEPLWAGGEPRAPRLALYPALEAALQAARVARRVVRGLEQTRTALAAQQRGLAAVDDRTGRPRRARVSRLLVLADDGADRFYRQVDQLLTQHAPRVIAVRLAVDEVTLGQRFFGPQQAARLLMVDHKDAVAKTLEAISDRWGPSNAG